ncbi:MAG: radical SAM protein [Acidobacteriia bacterium]|nr:radical SAM protein [Terriglobia bacterium]
MRIIPLNSQTSNEQPVVCGMHAVSEAGLVVVCPRYEENDFLGFSFTYGTACVQAYLRQQGIAAAHYLCSGSQGLESHADEILRLRPQAVSFTLSDSNYYLCYLTAKLIKDRRPEIATIGTGPAATHSYQLILDDPGSPFDLLIRGKAEVALETLFTTPGSLKEVASGFGYKRILTADDLPSLDAIPSPYVDGTIAAQVRLIERVGTLISRGCTRSCTWCELRSPGHAGAQFRSIDHVIEELSFLVQATRKERAGSNLFLPLRDRYFTIDRQRTLALLDRMISEGLNHELRFSCQTPADAADPELLQRLQMAGCSALNLRLDSASPRVLNRIKRNQPTEGADADYGEERRALAAGRENVRVAKELGIPTRLTITLGLPGETAEEGAATLAFVDGSDCTSYAHNFFRAVEGREAFGDCARYGIKVRPSASGLPYLTTPSYDVLSLPFSSRKPLANVGSRKTGQLNDHLRGFSTCFNPEDRTAPRFLYLHGAPADYGNEVLCDLRPHIAPDARLYLAEPAEAAAVAALYLRMVTQRLPVTCVYGRLVLGNDTRLVPFDQGERTPVSAVFSTQIESVPLQHYPDLQHFCASRNSHDWVGLLTIESLNDLETLASLCRQAEADGCFNVPPDLVGYKYALKESCRWGCRHCRDYFRLGVQAVHVSPEGSVRLCERGPIVGTLKEQPSVWRERMESFASDLERERGCDSCPATDRCAHCMVSEPISAHQYCSFHLNNPDAGELTNLLLMKQYLSPLGEKQTQAISGTADMKLSLAASGRTVYFQVSTNNTDRMDCSAGQLQKRVRIRDQKRLIGVQDMAYIVDLWTLEVIEISRPLAELWEAFQTNASPAAMRQFFTAKYSLSPETSVEQTRRGTAHFTRLRSLGVKEPAVIHPTSDEISFVYPKYQQALYKGCTFHYGVGSLRASLASAGIRSSMVMADRDCSIPGIVDKISATRAPIVGFTCYDENFYLASLIIEALKARNPEVKILIGGPVATFSDEWLLRNMPLVDYAVRGEAETTLPTLVTALLDGNGHRFPSAGISFLDGDQVIRTPDAELSGSNQKGAELDILPSPYISGFLPASVAGQLGFQTSRGCVYKCAYCNFTTIAKNRVRYFSVQRVLEELAFLAENLPDPVQHVISIFDDFFSVHLQRAKQILRGMIDLGLQKRMHFLCETRADAVDREFFALLKEAGGRNINFGLESAVPRVLRNAHKVSCGSSPSLAPEERFLACVEQAVKWAQEEKLINSVSIILGLPGETFEDGQATLEFVKRLNCTTYSHNFLQVFPGTELFENCEKWGIRLMRPVTGLPFLTGQAYNVFDLPCLPHGNATSRWKGRNRMLGAFVSGVPEYSDQPAMLDLTHVDDAGLSSLYQWITPASEVLVNYSGAITRDKVASDFERFTRFRLPIPRFTIIGENGSASVGSTANWGVFQPQNFDSRIQWIPFKEFQWQRVCATTDSLSQTLFLLSIEDEQDLAAFAKEIETLDRERSYSIPLEGFAHAVLLKDSCRFAAKPCVEIGSNRRWIARGQDMIPCFHGEPVGRLSGGPRACDAALTQVDHTKAELRSCEKCDSRRVCSHCPFPFPFASDASYCEFRRVHSGAAWFERVLWVKNALLGNETKPNIPKSDSAQTCRIKVDLGWSKPLLLDTPSIPQWTTAPPYARRVLESPFSRDAFLLSVPECSYAILPDTLEGAELTPALAAIWEAMCMRMEPGAMKQYFCDKYKIGSDCFDQNLVAALAEFEACGLLAPPAGA